MSCRPVRNRLLLSCSVTNFSEWNLLFEFFSRLCSRRIPDVSNVQRMHEHGSNRRPEFQEKKFKARRHSCLCLEVSVVCPAVSARRIYKSNDSISRYASKIKGRSRALRPSLVVVVSRHGARGNRRAPNCHEFLVPSSNVPRKRALRSVPPFQASLRSDSTAVPPFPFASIRSRKTLPPAYLCLSSCDQPGSLERGNRR